MDTPVRTTSFLYLTGQLMSSVFSLDLCCSFRICHHLALPWAPMPPRLSHEASLFMHSLSFSFTFNCLILLIFISLISWKWIDLIGWCSFFHSRPQNRSLVIQLIGCLSVRFPHLIQSVMRGGWNTLVLNMASYGSQQGLGWRSSLP